MEFIIIFSIILIVYGFASLIGRIDSGKLNSDEACSSFVIALLGLLILFISIVVWYNVTGHITFIL